MRAAHHSSGHSRIPMHGSAVWWARGPQIVSPCVYVLNQGLSGMPGAVCCWCSSSVLAGLCLRCPTILRHYDRAVSKLLSSRQTVVVLCSMCAAHRMCLKGSWRTTTTFFCSIGSDRCHFVFFFPFLCHSIELLGARISIMVGHRFPHG